MKAAEGAGPVQTDKNGSHSSCDQGGGSARSLEFGRMARAGKPSCGARPRPGTGHAPCQTGPLCPPAGAGPLPSAHSRNKGDTGAFPSHSSVSPAVRPLSPVSCLDGSPQALPSSCAHGCHPPHSALGVLSRPGASPLPRLMWSTPCSSQDQAQAPALVPLFPPVHPWPTSASNVRALVAHVGMLVSSGRLPRLHRVWA